MPQAEAKSGEYTLLPCSAYQAAVGQTLKPVGVRCLAVRVAREGRADRPGPSLGVEAVREA